MEVVVDVVVEEVVANWICLFSGGKEVLLNLIVGLLGQVHGDS